jgi:hypothetical protein
VNPVDEIASPARRFDLGLVAFVVGEELLLFVAFGFEEETAGLVEGATQPAQKFARTAEGERLAERLLKPVLGLSGTPEPRLADLLLEALLFCRGEVSQISAIL